MPCLVEMVGRKRSASVLQLPVSRADCRHVKLHVRLLRRPSALFQVAGQARGGDIFPARPPAQTARDDVVEGQVVCRPAILAFELVAQEQVEPREGGIFGRLHILAKRNDRRNLHVDAWAMHMPVVAGNDIDLVEKHRLDRGLPRPQAQRIIAQRRVIRIEHQRRTVLRVPSPCRCLESSGMKHKSNLLPCRHSRLSAYALQQFDICQPICGYGDVKRVKALNMVSLPIVDFGKQDAPVTRFAPSPNGRLHLGHAYSAMCAHDFARANGGGFHLRIEDIDGTRSRVEHVNTILADMEWLGLNWDGPVQFQSANVARYEDALERLKAMGLVYRCACSRGDIAATLKEVAVPHGPDGPHYPGTCRGRDVAEDVPHSWRLDMAKAVEMVGPLCWNDLEAGEQFADPMLFGDVVLWRKDAPASYHLAVTVDDAADGISHIVRGKDLFAYTAVHRLLQALLNLPEPAYWHHALLLDASGDKLAKRKSSPALAELRHAGKDGSALLDSLRQGNLPLGIQASNT